MEGFALTAFGGQLQQTNNPQLFWKVKVGFNLQIKNVFGSLKKYNSKKACESYKKAAVWDQGWNPGTCVLAPPASTGHVTHLPFSPVQNADWTVVHVIYRYENRPGVQVSRRVKSQARRGTKRLQSLGNCPGHKFRRYSKSRVALSTLCW